MRPFQALLPYADRQETELQVLGMTRLEIDPIISRSESGRSTSKATGIGHRPCLSAYALKAQFHVVRLIYSNAIGLSSHYTQIDMTTNVHEQMKEREIVVSRYPYSIHPTPPVEVAG